MSRGTTFVSTSSNKGGQTNDVEINEETIVNSKDYEATDATCADSKLLFRVLQFQRFSTEGLS